MFTKLTNKTVLIFFKDERQFFQYSTCTRNKRLNKLMNKFLKCVFEKRAYNGNKC